MKTTILLSPVFLTILCVGPVLAATRSSDPQELEVAIEVQAQAAADAADAAPADAHRQVERSLKTVERQLRLAQNQAGQAIAVAGPTIKRAFGASIVNTPEPPLVVATSKLDTTALAELREDLNVMSKLVNDAVAGEREETPGHSAMGIIVKWLPGASANNNLYVEGTGAIIQAAVRFPLAPVKQEAAAPAEEKPKNSAWESARRELYGGKQDEEAELVFPPEKREEYSADRVEELKKVLLKALANASNFRRLGEQETITVVVRNRALNRSEFVMFQANDAHGRVRRSNSDDDSTMTIRVKKADAEARAAGKIKEEDFAKRAQVAIY